jgi:hypothetical protein
MQFYLEVQLLNRIAQAIENQRPEVFSVRTKGYVDSQVGKPWSFVAPSDPIKLSALDASLDYFAKGLNVTVTLSSGAIVLSFLLSAQIRKSNNSNSSTVESSFSQPVALSALFGKLVGNTDADKLYPLQVFDASFLSIADGLRQLLSWVIANAISESLAKVGVPYQSVTPTSSPNTNIVLLFDPPSIRPDQVALSAALS